MRNDGDALAEGVGWHGMFAMTAMPSSSGQRRMLPERPKRTAMAR